MTISRADIVLVYDPRFSGGTATAMLADARAFHGSGATVGLLPVTSGFFTGDGDRPNAAVLELADLQGFELLKPGTRVIADTVFFHHPLTFFHKVAESAEIRAETSVLVAHHPPFRGDGSLEYDPIATTRTIRRAFGTSPMWAPVSGVIRQHLRSFLPFLRLTGSDWVNAFDAGDWAPRRQVFDGPVATVGRHSREDVLKWPDRAADVMASVAPPGPGWHTRVMGCPVQALEAAGVDPGGWEIVPFNGEPVDRFLDSLDVFSYFHSDRWIEAFGRTVLEAMLMERSCILDHRLRETFGPLAQYAAPAQVPDLLNALRNDPAGTRSRCAEIRQTVADRYASAAIPDRLRALQRDPGTSRRDGPVQASPLVTLRKLAGLARREYRAARETEDGTAQ
ncbi:glycosyltransferase family 1 protein [Ruegeria sp. 2205SS24-7]|uniref:glycosyltransferase family 1 protein n=1 Tax=Ruegeria discodermiae TaxID=3064389 RepID=UPI002740E3E3|nr:glycosyltransferase family 1 protein [Ruegeria sp. 2205SS24-7]MDP5220862.1 glycosyltransferase family 1 protein [Ruegeria sp. 2205SS24-7]